MHTLGFSVEGYIQFVMIMSMNFFDAAVSSKYIFNLHISQSYGGDILPKNMTSKNLCTVVLCDL